MQVTQDNHEGENTDQAGSEEQGEHIDRDEPSTSGHSSDDSADEPKLSAPQLSAIEKRVLGVLMEKQLTTPDQYPLTLNSVITACNQKSSREPVSNYNQGEVHRALQELDNKHFVRKERSSRSEKYSQQFMNHLELGRKQQALLCVMMLRGPQTISELNTRTQRMCEFTDKDELEHCIERLCHREIPYAIRMGHQPGQRGERIGHLFSGTPAITTSAQNQSTSSQSTAAATESSNNPSTNSAQSESIELLELEVATLTQSVNSLKTETVELKQQLAALYALTGHSHEC